MRKRRRRRKKSKTTNLGRAIWDRSPRATKAIASEKRELRSDAETASFSRKRVSISELLRALSRSMKRNGNLSTKRYDRTSSLGKSQPYNKRRERERVMGRTQKKNIKALTVLHTENSYSPTGSCERTLIVSVFSFAADILSFFLSLSVFGFSSKIKRAFFSVCVSVRAQRRAYLCKSTEK